MPEYGPRLLCRGFFARLRRDNMEKSYMRPDTLVELEFISNRSTDTHWHENYELMFVVSGSMV